MSAIGVTMAMFLNLRTIYSLRALMDRRLSASAIALSDSLSQYRDLADSAQFRLEWCSIKAIESMVRWERPR